MLIPNVYKRKAGKMGEPGFGDTTGLIKEVVFLENGNTLVADEKGEQIPELQVSWIGLYKEFLKSKGIEPEEIKFLVFNNKEEQ